MDEMKHDDRANPSGAPTAGGATTPGSQFGGQSMLARFLRLLARIARDLEATAYRRLREMEQAAQAKDPTGRRPGAPKRTKEAATPRDEGMHSPIH